MTLLDALGGGAGFSSLEDVQRVPLDHGAWVDVLPGWSHESDDLFDELARVVPWHAFERQMYGRTIAVPRLIKNYDEGEPFPDRRVSEAMDRLNTHYEKEGWSPTARFTRAGLNLYRTGKDSVAWHSDTSASPNEPDTMVAILSLGSPRTLAVRPRGGATNHRFELGHGDLLVMGGTFQRTHEHSVGKTGRAVGPRISVQYRPTWKGDGGGGRSPFTDRKA